MISLARKEFPSVLDALMALDGDPKNPYKFSPKVRYALAKNLRILSGRFKAVEKKRIDFIRELSPENFSIEPGTPQAVEFTKRWEDYESKDEELNLMRFTVGDFNLDVNSIPIAALSKLGPIIIEDVEVPAATSSV